MTGINVNRQRLLALADCHFIEPCDFLERATSRECLVRADDPQAAVHGLLDPSTGARFYVEEEKLRDLRWDSR